MHLFKDGGINILWTLWINTKKFISLSCKAELSALKELVLSNQIYSVDENLFKLYCHKVDHKGTNPIFSRIAFCIVEQTTFI